MSQEFKHELCAYAARDFRSQQYNTSKELNTRPAVAYFVARYVQAKALTNTTPKISKNTNHRHDKC